MPSGDVCLSSLLVLLHFFGMTYTCFDPSAYKLTVFDNEKFEHQCNMRRIIITKKEQLDVYVYGNDDVVP